MQTSNSNNMGGRKAVDLNGKNASNKPMGSIKSSTGMRGRKKKNVDDDDKFADLNMGLGDDQNDIESSWSGSAGKRKNYYDEEESDSYEGTGYGRGRMSYGSDDDEMYNDPYETFRRG